MHFSRSAHVGGEIGQTIYSLTIYGGVCVFDITTVRIIKSHVQLVKQRELVAPLEGGRGHLNQTVFKNNHKNFYLARNFNNKTFRGTSGKLIQDSLGSLGNKIGKYSS